MSLNTPGNAITVSPDIDPLYANTVDLTFTFDVSILYSSGFLDYLIDPVYFWSFGDGTYSFDLTPTHKYTAAGSYKVTLYITSTAAVLSCYPEGPNGKLSFLQADPLEVTTLAQFLIPSLPQGSFRTFELDLTVQDFVTTTFAMNSAVSASDLYYGIDDSNKQTEVIPSYLTALQELNSDNVTTLLYSTSGGFVGSTPTLNVLQGHKTDPLGVLFISTFVAPYRISLYARGSNSMPPGSLNPWPRFNPEWKFEDQAGNRLTDIVSTQENNIYLRLVNNNNLYSWQLIPPSQVSFDSDGNITDSTIFAVGSIVAANISYVDDIPATGVVLNAIVDTISIKDVTKQYMYANSALGAIANVNVLPSTPTQLVVSVRNNITDAGYTWTNATTPFTVTIADADGIILKDYPKTTAAIITINPSNSAISLDSATKTIPVSGGGIWGTFNSSTEILQMQLSAFGTIDGIPLSGVSVSANIYDYSANFETRKFNASFDMTEQFLAYSLQEIINKNTNLFEGVYKPFVGSIYVPEDNALGRTTYERIANLPQNISSIDNCHAEYIPSLLTMVDSNTIPTIEIFPAGIANLVDLWSNNTNQLRGNFEVQGNQIAYFGANDANLGARIGIDDLLTPGETIIAHRLYSPVNKIIQIGKIKTPIFDNVGLPYTLGQAISAYNTTAWGVPDFITGVWGLDDFQNYEFFRYVENTNPDQLNGVINWNDPLTTLSVSAINNSYTDDGEIVDIQFDYQLQRGLGLFN